MTLPLKEQSKDFYYEGTIAANPVDASTLKMAVFSCNSHYGFPNEEVVRNGSKHRPDMAVFLGDQFYESHGGLGVQPGPMLRSRKKPEGYDELRHELLFRSFEAGHDQVPWINSPMPNRKTDINNRWAVSTNSIGMNYNYPDGDYKTRERIVEDHKLYQQGHMWAMANHPRIPEHIREEYNKWGLAADEYTNTDNWTPQLYIREARRMVGEYVMTENDCRRLRVAEDPVGLGSYNMDSHNVQRYITKDGYVQNEGNLEYSPKGPYAISYRSLMPKREECTNLLVCCNGISSSHIAFGSIRMEPVFMVLGQSAAAAADIAIDKNGVVQDVPYQELKTQLLEEEQKLEIDMNQWPSAPPQYGK